MLISIICLIWAVKTNFTILQDLKKKLLHSCWHDVYETKPSESERIWFTFLKFLHDLWFPWSLIIFSIVRKRRSNQH